MLPTATDTVTLPRQFTTLVEDVASHSPWLITHWGTQLAIGFRGDAAYHQRCFNWAHNHGVTLGSLHYPYDRSAPLAYIVVREKRNADDEVEVPSLTYLIAGLRAQFRTEIIMAKEIAPLAVRTILPDEPEVDDAVTVEEDLDDERIEALAAERATQFLKTHFLATSFLRHEPHSYAPVFETHEPAFDGADEE